MHRKCGNREGVGGRWIEGKVRSEGKGVMGWGGLRWEGMGGGGDGGGMVLRRGGVGGMGFGSTSIQTSDIRSHFSYNCRFMGTTLKAQEKLTEEKISKINKNNKKKKGK